MEMDFILKYPILSLWEYVPEKTEIFDQFFGNLPKHFFTPSGVLTQSSKAASCG